MTQASHDPAAAIGRKVMVRLVAPAALFILMGSIDRTNVGFAALQMNESLGLSATQYGFGAGVLFVGYLLAKYPSVLLFEAIGMRRWLAIITAAWGLASMAMGLVTEHWQLYSLRMFIGFAEGGLSSGLMLYLSNWAPERYRASILAIPIVAISVAQVIGAPLSGWLLDQTWPGGIEAWRMMFVLEGLPAVLLALFALGWFPDRPSQAKWLSEVERRWLAENVNGSAPEGAPVDRSERWAALKSPVGWTCALVWYCILASNYGLMFWLPQIVKGLSGLSATQTGFIVALPWAASGIGLILNARHSDKTGERFFHVAVPALLGGILLLSAYLLGPGLPGLIALILGGACTGCTVAAFWAIPPQLLRPGALAMGIVIINMVGSLAGATVPPLMGFLRETTGSFLWPTLLLFGIACICATLALIARQQANRPLQGLSSAI
jgi:MFS transporter, ACS family, tartrate transporter